MSSLKGATECPVFHPTIQEVNGMTFVEYVERLERQKSFREAGICKIVAPDGWAPRRTGYSRLNFELPRPIRQHATGRQGLYRTLMVEGRRMALDEFRDMAREPLNVAPRNAEPEELERQFWRNVTLNPPLYGADIPGSLFEPQCKGWTLRRLRSLLSETLEGHGIKMPGVNEPYLYVGSWRSMFAWHTEDMDLHSVNYLHYGASKQWYVVPPAHRQRFELLMRSLLQDLFRACPEFMRHKELLVSPQLLATHAIPVVKVVHHPREFVVVFPGAYHSGFNHGFNIAESVNFATKSWLPIGAAANYCECQSDSARIDMRLFRDSMPAKLRRQVDEMYASSEEEEEEEEEGEEEEEEGSTGSGDEEAEEEAEDEVEEEAASEEEAPAKKRRRPQPKQQRKPRPRTQPREVVGSEAESTSDVEVEEEEEDDEGSEVDAISQPVKRSRSGARPSRIAPAAAANGSLGAAQQHVAAAQPVSTRPQRTRRAPRRDLDMVPVRLRAQPAEANGYHRLVHTKPRAGPGQGRLADAPAAPAAAPAASPPAAPAAQAAPTAMTTRKRSRSCSLAAAGRGQFGAAPPLSKVVGTSSRGRPLLLKIVDSAVSLLPFSAR